MSEKTICLRGYRESVESVLPEQEGMTAKQLAAMDQKKFVVPGYPTIKVGPGALVNVDGGPGAGKSTMGVRWADSMTPSLVWPYESGLSPVLSEMLRRLEIRNENLTFEMPRTIADAIGMVLDRRPRCVLIDSINCTSFTAQDLLDLARGSKSIVVAVFQHTKDGKPSLSNVYQHLSDVCISVAKGHWEITKSRYQESGIKGEVFSC